jgi:hypothetical protein
VGRVCCIFCRFSLYESFLLLVIAILNSWDGLMSRILYRERMREIALGTRILRYSLSKSKNVILMGVCGG